MTIPKTILRQKNQFPISQQESMETKQKECTGTQSYSTGVLQTALALGHQILETKSILHQLLKSYGRLTTEHLSQIKLAQSTLDQQVTLLDILLKSYHTEKMESTATIQSLGDQLAERSVDRFLKSITKTSSTTDS